MPKNVNFHGIVWDLGNVILAKCCIFELPKIYCNRVTLLKKCNTVWKLAKIDETLWVLSTYFSCFECALIT